MASKQFVISGEFYWAKVYEGHEDEYNGVQKYKITVVPDDKGWNEFKKAGLRLKVKPSSSDANDKSVTFSRQKEGKPWVSEDGETRILGGGAPRVFDSDGNILDENTLIGNGSKGAVLVEVYDTKMGKGHRLEAIKVYDLVPYTKSLDTDPFAAFESGDDAEEIEETVTVNKKTKKEVGKTYSMDDELPF